MIPRYQPNLNILSWWKWIVTQSTFNQPETQSAFISSLNITKDRWHINAFINARQGLLAYYRQIKQRYGSGSILVPAQICPIVPLTIRMVGLDVRFIDIDPIYPTPPITNYQQAIDKTTIGMIVAPLYGHIQDEWKQTYPKDFGNINIVLDMAQGLGLTTLVDAPLYQKADGIIYSFGLGKGIDTGGGLVISAFHLPIADFTYANKIPFLKVLLQSMIVRTLLLTGQYPRFISRLETEVEAAKELKTIQGRKFLAPHTIYSLWIERLKTFTEDIYRAKKYANLIKNNPIIQKISKTPEYYDETSIHLRQIIRVKQHSLQPVLLDTLRRHSIDCAPAGEPLPHEYFGNYPPINFPNAVTFKEEAIRLPFLGRLSEADFRKFYLTLEKVAKIMSRQSDFK